MAGPPEGPLSAVVMPIAEAIVQHQALPPFQKNAARASMGAFLLTYCVYAAAGSPAVFFGQSLGAAVSAFLRAPSAPPLALAVWAGCAAFGLLWFCLGIRGARSGPRDIMGVVWAVLAVIGCAVALLRHWYLSPELGDWVWLVNVLLRGWYIATIAASLVRFVIAAGFGQGNALRTINRQINRRNSPLRPARPRRRFLFR
jgi:hypothetical protein